MVYSFPTGALFKHNTQMISALPESSLQRLCWLQAAHTPLFYFSYPLMYSLIPMFVLPWLSSGASSDPRVCFTLAILWCILTCPFFPWSDPRFTLAILSCILPFRSCPLALACAAAVLYFSSLCCSASSTVFGCGREAWRQTRK